MIEYFDCVPDDFKAGFNDIRAEIFTFEYDIDDILEDAEV
jgi:hypothetical protein